MTLREVAHLLGMKENTIYKNLRRTQDNLRKKGIYLSRWGTGKDADYELEYEELEDEEEE